MFNAKIIVLALCMLITGKLGFAGHLGRERSCRMQSCSWKCHPMSVIQLTCLCALAGTVNTITTKYQARRLLLASTLCISTPAEVSQWVCIVG